MRQGKSTLSSVIIDHIRQEDLGLVAFSYCKHRDPDKNTFMSIIKALLDQLVHQQGHLTPYYYDVAVGSGEVTLTTTKLGKRLLQCLLLSIPRSYLIIDGLDECDMTERKMTLGFLAEMVDACDNVDPGKMRLLILSRGEPDIRKAMATSTVVRVDEQDTIEDMRCFINNRAATLQNKFNLSAEDRAYVEKNVLDRSDGEPFAQ